MVTPEYIFATFRETHRHLRSFKGYETDLSLVANLARDVLKDPYDIAAKNIEGVRRKLMYRGTKKGLPKN